MVGENTRDVHQLALKGGKLSREEVNELEKMVEREPDNFDARAQLIGYYFLHQRKSSEHHIAHVKWLVENHPDNTLAGTGFITLAPNQESETYKVTYAHLESVWEKHIQAQPTNVTILDHAASFVTLDNIQLAEKYLLRAKEIEPTNPRWSERLAHLYSLSSLRNSSGEAEALAEIERSLSLENDPTRQFYIKTNLVQMAYDAGSYERASEVARELLDTVETYRADWNYGNAINMANTVIGRIALMKGDIPLARNHLLNSAIGAKSPQNSSFGPAMHLAGELLKAGEQDAVLQYFDGCELFWSSGKGRLRKWRDKLKKRELAWEELMDTQR